MGLNSSPILKRKRLLLLGGAQEASALGRSLAARGDLDATLSLAGRTARPAPSLLPTRVGGFGGVEGLVHYLNAQSVDLVIDATHPFAAQMSTHAVAACGQLGLPLAVFTRPSWRAGEGDRWREVDSAVAAAEGLGAAPRRVFLTVGRLQAGAFKAAPQHHYVLRSIDAPDPQTLPPLVDVVLARGPFSIADETELMRGLRVDALVTKNSGGEATRAKLDAARALGVEVVMIRRPATAAETVFHELKDALAWIEAHVAAP